MKMKKKKRGAEGQAGGGGLGWQGDPCSGREEREAEKGRYSVRRGGRGGKRRGLAGVTKV